jgi:hypothetical protein
MPTRQRGEDPSLAADEEGVREVSHPVGMSRLGAGANGIAEFYLLSFDPQLLLVVDPNAQHLEALCAVLLVEFVQRGGPAHAARRPRCPEVQHQWSALEITESNGHPLEGSQREVERILAWLGLCRSSLRKPRRRRRCVRLAAAGSNQDQRGKRR